jgi:hypothetical protein
MFLASFMKSILVVLASLVAAVVTFYGAMTLTMVLIGLVWHQSSDRDLGLGMMLLIAGVPAWLLAATVSGILTARKLRNKLAASRSPN